MGRDRVTVCEGVETGGQHAAIGERNAAVLNRLHLHPFAVNKFFAMVGLEQQPVTGGDLEFAGFTHIEEGGGRWTE